MPTRDHALFGAPCWIDLLTSDTEKARSFYPAVFGWTAEEPDPNFGGYFMFTLNGQPIGGGMGQMPDSQTPDGWTIYLSTDDTRKRVADATAAGAQTYVEPMDVATLGVMAVIADPAGAAIGLWQPIDFSGFGVIAESSAPSWFELNSRDYDTSVAFYRDVLGWDTHVMSDTPEFRYTTLGEGEQQSAGIMDAAAFLPEGVPSHWSVYFGTDDTDATLKKISELGGQVVRPAEDTPYGRLATAADPTGALFKLVAPNDQMPARS